MCHGYLLYCCSLTLGYVKLLRCEVYLCDQKCLSVTRLKNSTYIAVHLCIIKVPYNKSRIKPWVHYVSQVPTVLL
jgi:hypothetical protein